MQVQRQLEALGLSKKCVNQLWFRLELRGSLERVQQQFSSGRPSEAARQALHELTAVTEYADKLELSCPLVVHPGEHTPPPRCHRVSSLVCLLGLKGAATTMVIMRLICGSGSL